MDLFGLKKAVNLSRLMWLALKIKQQSTLYQFLHVSSRRRSELNHADKMRESTIYEILALEEIEGREGEFVRADVGYIYFDSCLTTSIYCGRSR